MEPIEKVITEVYDKYYEDEDGNMIREKKIEVITRVKLRMKDDEVKNVYYELTTPCYLLFLFEEPRRLNKTELNEISRQKKKERYANDPEYRGTK
jgi:hypothetical protein